MFSKAHWACAHTHNTHTLSHSLSRLRKSTQKLKIANLKKNWNFSDKMSLGTNVRHDLSACNVCACVCVYVCVCVCECVHMCACVHVCVSVSKRWFCRIRFLATKKLNVIFFCTRRHLEKKTTWRFPFIFVLSDTQYAFH